MIWYVSETSENMGWWKAKCANAYNGHRLHNKTSAAWAARARSIDFHWRGHIRLQECTHLIFMRLKAHRNNKKKIPTLWHINVASKGNILAYINKKKKMKQRERLNCVIKRPLKINCNATSRLDMFCDTFSLLARERLDLGHIHKSSFSYK